MNETSPSPTAGPDFRLRTYFARWWQGIVHLDGPTWRSLRALIVSPGKLAARQCEPGTPGSLRPVHPVRLYLVINVAFFFLAPWVNSEHVSAWKVNHQVAVSLWPSLSGVLDGAVERSEAEDRRLYLAVFDERLSAQQGALVWLMIPTIALAGFAVAKRRRRYLVEHLIFATNFVSFFLVSVMVVGLASRAVLAFGSDKPLVMGAIGIVVLAWLSWVPWTIFRSCRVFFELRHWLVTSVMTVWLGAGFTLGFWLYLLASFWMTVFGLRDLSFAVAG